MFSMFKKKNAIQQLVKDFENSLKKETTVIEEIDDDIRKKIPKLYNKLYIKNQSNKLNIQKYLITDFWLKDWNRELGRKYYQMFNDSLENLQKKCSEKEIIEKIKSFINKYPFFITQAITEDTLYKNYFVNLKDYTDFMREIRNFEPENKEEEMIASILTIITLRNIENDLAGKFLNAMPIIDNKVYIDKKQYEEFKKIKKLLGKNINAKDIIVNSFREMMEKIPIKEDFIKDMVINFFIDFDKYLEKNGYSSFQREELMFYLSSNFIENELPIFVTNYEVGENYHIPFFSKRELENFMKNSYITGGLGFLIFKEQRFKNTIKYLKEKGLENLKEFAKANEVISEFLDEESKVHSFLDKYANIIKIISPVKTGIDRDSKIFINKAYENNISIEMIEKDYKKLPAFLKVRFGENVSFEEYYLAERIIKRNKKTFLPLVSKDLGLFYSDIDTFAEFFKSLTETEFKLLLYFYYKNSEELKSNKEVYSFLDRAVAISLFYKEAGNKRKLLTKEDKEVAEFFLSMMNKILNGKGIEDLSNLTIARSLEFSNQLKNFVKKDYSELEKLYQQEISFLERKAVNLSFFKETFRFSKNILEKLDKKPLDKLIAYYLVTKKERELNIDKKEIE